ELVTDRETGLDLDAPVVDVKVRTADPAALDGNQGLVWLSQLGLGSIHNFHRARSLKRDRLQERLVPIPEEPFARQPPQPTVPHQRPQHRPSTVALFAALLQAAVQR